MPCYVQSCSYPYFATFCFVCKQLRTKKSQLEHVQQQTPVVSKEANVSNEYEGPQQIQTSARIVFSSMDCICVFVACMIDAEVLPVKCCVSSPSHVEEQQNQGCARRCVFYRGIMFRV